MLKVGQKVLCDNVETKFTVEDEVPGIIVGVKESVEKFDEETGEFVEFDTLYTVAFLERAFGNDLTNHQEETLAKLNVKYFDCTTLVMFADDVVAA